MSDVQVTQEDREAASQFWADTACLYGTQDKLLAEAFALHRLATRPAPVGEPVAWMYREPRGPGAWKLHFKVSMLGDLPDGWTETPLYTRPALDVDGLVEKVARAMLDSIENGGNITDFLDHLADYPERALSKLATAALAAIKDATDAQ